MYKICVAILVIYSLFSCSQPQINERERLLSGKFELRKFNVKTTINQQTCGYWFLVVGSYSSKTVEESKIRFYFLTRFGDYMFKEMDFKKVNIRIDSTIKVPYIKFYWAKYSHNGGYNIYEYDITRAVIYCKNEDFKPEINFSELR